MFGYAEGVMRGCTHLAYVAFVTSCNAATERLCHCTVFVSVIVLSLCYSLSGVFSVRRTRELVEYAET